MIQHVPDKFSTEGACAPRNQNYFTVKNIRHLTFL